MAKLSIAKYNLNLLCLRRFCAILKLACSTLSCLLVTALLLLSVGEQVLVYYVGLLASNFTQVLVDHDFAGFQSVLLRAFVLILAISGIKAVIEYVSNILYIQWRATLTTKLHQFYLLKFNYHHINASQECIDNVDQRITQDASKLLLTTSQIFPVVILSPLTISYYTYDCYLVTGAKGPLVVLAVFLLGSCVNKFLITPVVSWTVRQEKAEGNFRFAHMNIRANSESIAFYNGGEYELSNANSKLSQLITIQYRVAFYKFIVDCFTKFYNYFGAIQSYIVVAYPVFTGKYELFSSGQISELISAYAFKSIYLNYCFSQLIDLAKKISEIASMSHRVGELWESFEYYDRNFGDIEIAIRDNDENLFTPKKNGIILELKKVSVDIPEKKEALLRELSLKLSYDSRLLITGKAGVGKSSILRLVNRIWVQKEGIIHNQATSCMTVPQKVYFCQGSLLDQLFYPKVISADYEKIVAAERVLGQLHLDYIIERCGSLTEEQSWNWASVFSQGEAQRISFARVLLQKPELLLLDEATSAVDQSEESSLYRVIRDAGIECFVTIGHRESLREHHNCFLHLDGPDDWALEMSHGNMENTEQGTDDDDGQSSIC